MYYCILYIIYTCILKLRRWSQQKYSWRSVSIQTDEYIYVMSQYWDLQPTKYWSKKWIGKKLLYMKCSWDMIFHPLLSIEAPSASGALGMARAFSLSGVSCTIMTPWHRPRSASPIKWRKMAQWEERSAQVEHMWKLVFFFFCEQWNCYGMFWKICWIFLHFFRGIVLTIVLWCRWKPYVRSMRLELRCNMNNISCTWDSLPNSWFVFAFHRHGYHRRKGRRVCCCENHHFLMKLWLDPLGRHRLNASVAVSCFASVVGVRKRCSCNLAQSRSTRYK